ncbi:unnamed protein product, partial [Effrenium voratum]
MDGWSRAAACGKLLVALYVLHKLPRLLRYWPARPLGPRAFAPGAGPPFLRWSACRLAEAIRRRELTAEQVVDAFIQRLQDVDVHLNALVAERFDAARQQAREVDRRIASEKGELPPFLGVPIVVKEAFEYPGFPYTNGLLSRKGRLGVKAGYAVQRVEAAGFLVLATTNISEACMWMESYNLVYGRVASPFGSHLSPGGSSGGSAALVAALGVPVGLTADIGGSTRIPALLNGLFGHKPTGGIIPNHGTHLEEFHGAVCRICQMGAVARHAEDLAPLLRIMAGPPSPEARLAHEYRACPVWRPGADDLQRGQRTAAGAAAGHPLARDPGLQDSAAVFRGPGCRRVVRLLEHPGAGRGHGAVQRGAVPVEGLLRPGRGPARLGVPYTSQAS